jgi:hypothetical protein
MLRQIHKIAHIKKDILLTFNCFYERFAVSVYWLKRLLTFIFLERITHESWYKADCAGGLRIDKHNFGVEQARKGRQDDRQAVSPGGSEYAR